MSLITVSCTNGTMKTNYFTGLPAGKKHNYVKENGKDYICYVLQKSDDLVAGFPEQNVKHTNLVLQRNDFEEWVRIRALTLDDAIERFFEAVDQWHYYINGTEAYWRKHNESEYLNVVKYPRGERPECPDNRRAGKWVKNPCETLQ